MQHAVQESTLGGGSSNITNFRKKVPQQNTKTIEAEACDGIWNDTKGLLEETIKSEFDEASIQDHIFTVMEAQEKKKDVCSWPKVEKRRIKNSQSNQKFVDEQRQEHNIQRRFKLKTRRGAQSFAFYYVNGQTNQEM